jgi:hypothetical protein
MCRSLPANGHHVDKGRAEINFQLNKGIRKRDKGVSRSACAVAPGLTVLKINLPSSYHVSYTFRLVTLTSTRKKNMTRIPKALPSWSYKGPSISNMQLCHILSLRFLVPSASFSYIDHKSHVKIMPNGRFI